MGGLDRFPFVVVSVEEAQALWALSQDPRFQVLTLMMILFVLVVAVWGVRINPQAKDREPLEGVEYSHQS